MNILKMLWAAYPLEVAIYGAITVFGSVGFAVCLLAVGLEVLRYQDMKKQEGEGNV